MPQALIVFLLTLAYAAAGSLLLWLGYRLFDRLTPGNMHEKIFEEGNTAVAVLAGAFIVGLACVISASILS
jgi:putative membrane protein